MTAVRASRNTLALTPNAPHVILGDPLLASSRSRPSSPRMAAGNAAKRSPADLCGCRRTKVLLGLGAP